MRLDLACGAHKKEGFVGVDCVKLPGVDIVQDLQKYPWPFPLDSADEIYCAHFLEHIPGKHRPAFMDEVWRVCKPGALVVIVVPYWTSHRSIQDYTHEWPPLCEQSFLYFSRWRREEFGLSHYEMKCDFDLEPSYMDEENKDLTMILRAKK